MKKGLLGLAALAALLLLVAPGGAATSTAAHHPLYMPNVNNIHNPALQPPPVCCIPNPGNQLAGVWYDDTNAIHNNVSGLELPQEAQRAVAHFGEADLHNAQFVIAQPQKFDEAGFNSGAGYCAWHDYTQPQYYPGVQAGISFTNMPYVLNSGTSCGQNSVNSGFYAGRLDGFTIVVGHEIEETVTDPGAEDVINGQNLGGWD